jgi:hypothetical protein
MEIRRDLMKQIAQWALNEAVCFPDFRGDGEWRCIWRVPPYTDQLLVLWTFSQYIPELVILAVNSSLPFGWMVSPVTNSTVGQAIKAVHTSRPGFHNLVDCNDLIMIDHSSLFCNAHFGYFLAASSGDGHWHYCMQ